MAVKGRLSRGVALVGAGMSKFGSFASKSSRDLFVEAFNDMRRSVDKGLDPKEIQSLYVGNFSSDLFEGQGHIAPIAASWAGLVPVAATRVENACASGGAALRQGIIAVASGLYDVVLVGGVEKMTALPTERVTDTLAAAADAIYEAPAGFTFPGLFAAMATVYMDRYGATPEDFMRVGIKNHENGALNPKAQFNSTLRAVMQGRVLRAQQKGLPMPTWRDEMDFLHDDSANPIVAWPMRLFDCSPISDGAACVLLVAEELAPRFTERPLLARGIGQASDHGLSERADMASLSSARHAAQQAYEMAGVKPEDVRIAEVHDCFTIAELIAAEDIGFFPRGHAAAASNEGQTRRTGPRPINTSGGLKSKGHPVGASGVAQVVEVWLQMHGQAGDRQVPGDIPLALTHNVGGTGATCVVHIWERK